MKKELDIKSLNEYIDNRLGNAPRADKKDFIKEDRLIPWIVDELIKMDFMDECKPVDEIYNKFLKRYSKSRQKELNEDGDLELDDEALAKAAGGINLSRENLEEND